MLRGRAELERDHSFVELAGMVGIAGDGVLREGDFPGRADRSCRNAGSRRAAGRFGSRERRRCCAALRVPGLPSIAGARLRCTSRSHAVMTIAVRSASVMVAGWSAAAGAGDCGGPENTTCGLGSGGGSVCWAKVSEAQSHRRRRKPKLHEPRPFCRFARGVRGCASGAGAAAAPLQTGPPRLPPRRSASPPFRP